MANSTEYKARLLIDDPVALFERSITKMHSMPRKELEELQRLAISMRFKEHYEKIEIVRKHADKHGIKEVKAFDDLAPLLFPHTAFKSYPASLLENKRYDLLNKWLDKQTVHDLSKVDTSGCQNIEEYIKRLDEQTPLNVITSSGTTGTLSLIPKSKKQSPYGQKIWHMFMFQTFGKEPTDADLNATVDLIWPQHTKGTVGIIRSLPDLKAVFTGGDESRFHALYDWGIETDLLLLASRMRAAAAKGELDRLKVDPVLLARKKEFEAQQARMPEDLKAFINKCVEQLAGKRIYTLGSPAMLYTLAVEGLARGSRRVFAPDSIVLLGGGMKGHVLPDNYQEVIKEFLGVDQFKRLYGFSEGGSSHFCCQHDRYHIQPWTIPFLLDPDTSEPLPRKGVQTGRAAFYDLSSDSHWGGVITGDEVTIDWDTPCSCGLTSLSIPDNIIRYSEKQGVEDDRITCSATQSFADEAIDFMKGYEQ